eukprot:CAMPEP_0176034374 /NCGR_PEP_ID=MMETSP0120_2-20121206/16990_1 /TAXON_ID=160619 /ORGANISM="Kryptoperidinium foliaceum, Strain CCMP 1326" /LENGTH=30 /DNA_ID= /DNA_START= /DNA_END= /DNA_ORIENTATION=
MVSPDAIRHPSDNFSPSSVAASDDDKLSSS